MIKQLMASKVNPQLLGIDSMVKIMPLVMLGMWFIQGLLKTL